MPTDREPGPEELEAHYRDIKELQRVSELRKGLTVGTDVWTKALEEEERLLQRVRDCSSL